MNLKCHVGPGGTSPLRAYPTDAGFDLFTSETAHVEPGHLVNLPTSVRIEVPAGYWGRIIARSSTASYFGLDVLEGIIDAGYVGELKIRVQNLRKPETIVVPHGTRLAQFILLPLPEVELEYVTDPTHIPAGPRGSNGFGSSGVGA